MSEITYGRGTHEQFAAYMEFINMVFGFQKGVNEFETLLPKLYRPELDPAVKSFTAMEDGRFVGAVGAYPLELSVCGTPVKGVGIGNVAVHPAYRSRGIMQKLLTMAVDDMVEQGACFSALGGQRQRYNYFSYDCCGPLYCYHIGPNNLRHFFPADSALRLTAAPVEPDDAETLDAIAALSDAQAYHPVRRREELYNILCSWRDKPWVFRENGKFAGYCVLSESGRVSEILAAKDEDLLEMIRVLAAPGRDIQISIPGFRTDYRKALEPFVNSVSIGCSEQFTVLRFREVLDAFLRLKASCCNLSDGRMTVLVHGRGGDERLEITAEAGRTGVAVTQAEADVELSHLEAMNFFFAPACALRSSAPAVASNWFPLPLWLYSADAV